MRAQYHFRPGPQGLRAWDVRRLARLSADLPARSVPLSRIRELDEPYWFAASGDEPTCRAVAEHMALVLATDLSFPIILCAEGRIMDGMHRVVRAHLEGAETVKARRFAVTPAPDHVGKAPHELPYDE